MAKRQAQRAHPLASGPLMLCRGGPWDGFWYSVPDWEKRRAAATNMGYTPDDPTGYALGYHRTAGVEANPDCDVTAGTPATGTVWAWRPGG